MRSTDERIAAVQARSRSLQRRRARRRDLAISGVSAAACVAAICAFAVYVPGVIAEAPASPSGTSGVYGSIMASGGYLGFIVIGILAFCLGIAVTMLCVKLRERERDAGDAGLAEPAESVSRNAPAAKRDDGDGSR